MARIKFGLAISDIRGSISGTTFSSGTYGAYARRRAVPTNPNTAKQGAIRATFASLTSSWRNLTEAQRLTWITQAPNYTNLNSFGDNVPLTGQALFMRCNLNLASVNLSPISSALPPKTLIAPSMSFLSADVSAGEILLNSRSATDSTTRLAIYVTPNVSAGINFFARSAFRFVDYITTSQASGNEDIAGKWEALYGAPLSVGMIGNKIAVYINAIDVETGQSFNSGQYTCVIQA